MMFGHVENMFHVAHHLLRLLDIQNATNGLTEFVPLPFVAEEAPIYRKGKSRHGPTFKETILVHSVARILFNGKINNIKGSWVKMGLQELNLHDVICIADDLDLNLIQRNTLYEQLNSSLKDIIKLQSTPLIPIVNEYHQPKITSSA